MHQIRQSLHRHLVTFQFKDASHQHRKSHGGYISYTGKTTSLWWNRALFAISGEGISTPILENLCCSDSHFTWQAKSDLNSHVIMRSHLSFKIRQGTLQHSCTDTSLTSNITNRSCCLQLYEAVGHGLTRASRRKEGYKSRLCCVN